MEALMELPGIGRSTAAGIMAFAWNKPEPMIDTNVRRILTRVFYRGKKIQPSDHELYLLARSLIPEGRGREWNYAMLDLGATECTARNHSMACPLIPLHGGVKESVRGRSSEPFRESRRFLRGEIIRRVIALEGRGITERALLRDLPTSSHDAEDLIARLISEGLLARKNGRVSLSGEGDHLRRQKQ
jgi:A/G-specific adenine glycosylase